ncbi:MAG: DUF1552 domain-containing protein [Deltaproteobacteria bacterium]|nr:DUF1552 domain-containing protein [Deltaproteobacteria bacterium]
MKRRELTRRTMLKGLLGGAVATVALPPLECLLGTGGRAWADGTGLPVRFGLFFWGNGVLPKRWIPEGAGPDWEVSEQLTPLMAAGVKDQVTVLTGMNMLLPNINPHWSGAAGWLTGKPLIDADDHDTFAGPTIDQMVAQAIGGTTRFRSLEVGVEAKRGQSFSAANTRNPIEKSPHGLYERVFGVGFTKPGEEAVVDPRVGLRRSVLDAVLGQAKRLKADLGANDALRLEQHMASVRELELRLARMQESPPQLEACVVPPPPDGVYVDADAQLQISATNRAMCDLIALTLACDQTRVFSNWFSDPVSNVQFPGSPAGYHQLTHEDPGEQEEVHRAAVQIVAEYAYLVKALRDVPEGDGTLLDRCAVLGTSDVSRGLNHGAENIPVLIAGSAGGRLRTGIHHASPTGANIHRVMLTLLRAMGIPQASVSEDEAFTTEGVPGIEV